MTNNYGVFVQAGMAMALWSTEVGENSYYSQIKRHMRKQIIMSQLQRKDDNYVKE